MTYVIIVLKCLNLYTTQLITKIQKIQILNDKYLWYLLQALTKDKQHNNSKKNIKQKQICYIV